MIDDSINSPHLVAEQLHNDSEFIDVLKIDCNVDDSEMSTSDIKAGDAMSELCLAK